MILKPIFDHTRFDRWKHILDQYDAGEVTDVQASKMLDDLRQEEQKKLGETLCPGE